MLGRLHGVEHVTYQAIRTDDNRDAFRILGAVIGSCTKRNAQLFVGVAQQRIGEVKLLPERAVLFDGVKRHATDGRFLRIKLGLQITEALAFNRSTRRVGFGIEPQDERFAGEVLQRASIAFVVGDREIWSRGAEFEHGETIGHCTASSQLMPKRSSGSR